jgi:hypothetical protein
MSVEDSMVHDPAGTRVLVVDDEEDIRAVLVEHLSDPHTECIGAPGAFDALNKIGTFSTGDNRRGCRYVRTELLRYIKKR